MSLTQSPEMTPAKRAAQRSNARRSTGPRTGAGKSRSRLNALRHGGYATHLAWSDEALRALGENPLEFRELASRLQAAEGPSDDPLWETQLEDLARLCWRKRRVERAWEILAARQAEAGEPSELAALTLEGQGLLRQLDALDRALDRRMRLLVRLREGEERCDRRTAESVRRHLRQEDQAIPEGFGKSLPPDERQVEQAVELARRKRSNTRLERQVGALLEEFEGDAADENLEERSQNVAEKKGEGGQVTSDEENENDER